MWIYIFNKAKSVGWFFVWRRFFYTHFCRVGNVWVIFSHTHSYKALWNSSYCVWFSFFKSRRVELRLILTGSHFLAIICLSYVYYAIRGIISLSFCAMRNVCVCVFVSSKWRKCFNVQHFIAAREFSVLIRKKACVVQTKNNESCVCVCVCVKA